MVVSPLLESVCTFRVMSLWFRVFKFNFVATISFFFFKWMLGLWESCFEVQAYFRCILMPDLRDLH